MQKPEIAGILSVPEDIAGKSRELLPPCHLSRPKEHALPGNVKGTVIHLAAVALDAAVIVSRMKQEHASSLDGIFPVPAGKPPLTLLYKPNDVMLVKMVGKGLHNPQELISFYF